MDDATPSSSGARVHYPTASSTVPRALLLRMVVGFCVTVPLLVGLTTGSAKATTTTYPVGVVNPAAPSGLSPPGIAALPGFRRNYVSNFGGTSLPVGWAAFSGIPGGDPGGQFALSHVVVSGGLLRVSTWPDPLYQNRWVTGGLCQCKLARVYGAYFVRSRITGPGPNVAELLWPVTDIWPPEIDFNENGGRINYSSSTVHFRPGNQMIHRSLLINMRQWHTWGVVWTPTVISYIVDGRIWASVSDSSKIPRVAMDLNLELRTKCAIGKQCPTSPQSLFVDWVAEYVPL